MPWRWGMGSLSGVCLHTRTHTHTHIHTHSPLFPLPLATCTCVPPHCFGICTYFHVWWASGYTLYIICLYRLATIYCMNTVQMAGKGFFVILIRWGAFLVLFLESLTWVEEIWCRMWYGSPTSWWKLNLLCWGSLTCKMRQTSVQVVPFLDLIMWAIFILYQFQTSAHKCL